MYMYSFSYLYKGVYSSIYLHKGRLTSTPWRTWARWRTRGKARYMPHFAWRS